MIIEAQRELIQDLQQPELRSSLISPEESIKEHLTMMDDQKFLEMASKAFDKDEDDPSQIRELQEENDDEDFEE